MLARDRQRSKGFSFRPMGRLHLHPDDNEWTIRFLTDGRSRKAHEMRRNSGVGMIYQPDPDEAYVTLLGKARLLETGRGPRPLEEPL